MESSNQTMMSQSSGETTCSKCHGEGYYLYEDENGYEFVKECECGLMAQRRAERKLRFANIPETFKSCTLKNFRSDVYTDKQSKENVKMMVKAVKYWLDNLPDMIERGKGLYLYSNTKGSGKTRMAASLANELLENRKICVKFATSMQILNEIKATWDKDGETQASESSLLNQLIEVPVLIIDDFGTEEVKGWIYERFYHLINGRYIDKMTTIFTSNCSIDDLAYDDRITNRIKEMCYVIPFPEESVRDHIADFNKQEMLNNVKGG